MPAQCHSNAGSPPDRRHSREESLPDRHSREGSPPDRDSREESPPDCHSRESGNLFFYERPRGLTTLFILFAAMIALALFQMVPLPEGVLKLISPVSLSTYATFGNAPAGAYHPISINPDATRRELFRVLAYAAIFFVIISHYRTKEQVHSLVKTILAMGCFLVLFAIIQKMTWNGRIFWIYPVDEGVPMAGVKRS